MLCGNIVRTTAIYCSFTFINKIRLWGRLRLRLRWTRLRRIRVRLWWIRVRLWWIRGRLRRLRVRRMIITITAYSIVFCINIVRTTAISGSSTSTYLFIWIWIWIWRLWWRWCDYFNVSNCV